MPRVRIRPAPPYEPRVRTSVDSGPPTMTVDRPRASTVTAVARRSRKPEVVDEAESAATSEARRFAVATITLLLEVLDRRRGVRQLETVLSTRLIDQVAALARLHGAAPSGALRGARDNSAALRRVHVQMVGPAAAEVFGSFGRGARVRAFAGRIELCPCRVRLPNAARSALITRTLEYRWQLVTFTIP